ncbi:MAG TPA: hypothetical protein VJ464_09360 [Blastocatellia bacterium]|nr:hypothetical protein [Blastocatellia bacterium]
MKRAMIYLSMALMLIGAAVAASAAPSDKEVTLKGEIIDQPCYDKGGKKGEAHKACALSCAKRGNQMAILEDGTSTVYSIEGDYAENKNEKLIPYVAESVEVKGTVSEKDGKKYLTITSIKKADTK